MKKNRILSILLSTTIIVSLLIVAPSAVNAASAKKYKGIIKSAINSQNKADYNYSGYSFLYDFDNNGIKELVMLYDKRSDKYNSKRIITIHTIKKGKVKQIYKTSIVLDNGITLHIGIAIKKEKRYFFYNTDHSSPSYQKGKIVLYNIKGTKIKTKEKAKYSYKYNMIKNNSTGSDIKTLNNSTIKINGKKKTVKQFLKWQKNLKLSFVKRRIVKSHNPKHYFYDNSGKCKTLQQTYTTFSKTTKQ